MNSVSSSATPLSGIVTGLDTTGLIQRILSIEQQPITQLQNQQKSLQGQLSLFQNLNTKMMAVGTALTPLSQVSSFLGTAVNVTGPTVATATLSGTPTIGSHTLTVQSLGTSSHLDSTAQLSRLNLTASLGRAGFSTAPTMASLTPDGFPNGVTNLQGQSAAVRVADATQIAAGSYAIDVAGLATASQWQSQATHVDPTQPLSNAFPALNYNGSFKLNGTAIAVSQTDTLNDVISHINSSAAGVTASYDATSGVMTLKNKLTGADAITSSSDTVGFMHAFGFDATQQAVGQDADFHVTAGGTTVHYRSADNANLSIPELPGLQFDLLASGHTTFDVNNEANTFQGGDLKVNGHTVQYTAGESMTDVMRAVNGAGAGVTLSYDRASDRFTFTSASGGAVQAQDVDGNLLQAMGFDPNASGTGTLTSARTVSASIDTGLDMSIALRAPVTPGSFAINGTSIQVQQGDTLTKLLQRINNAGAGVTARYDAAADHLVLSRSDLGNGAITVGSDTSGFLAAAHLDTAQATAGTDVRFTLDGTPMTRTSTTVTDAIPGVSLQLQSTTATGAGDTTVSVQQDHTATTKNVQAFVQSVNDLFTFIAQNSQAPQFDATGQVVKAAGAFLGNADINSIHFGLQQALTNPVEGLPGGMNSLADVGITLQQPTTAGGALQLALDTTKLGDALQQNPDGVNAVFTQANRGVTAAVNGQLNQGTQGGVFGQVDLLQQKLTSLASRAQVLTSRVAQDSEFLSRQFVAMELTMSTLQQQGNALGTVLSAFSLLSGSTGSLLGNTSSAATTSSLTNASSNAALLSTLNAGRSGTSSTTSNPTTSTTSSATSASSLSPSLVATNQPSTALPGLSPILSPVNIPTQLLV